MVATDRITAALRSIHCIRQVSPVHLRLYVVNWAHASLSLKRQLDRFVRFCRAYQCTQQSRTDTHGYRSRRSVCSIRPHLCSTYSAV